MKLSEQRNELVKASEEAQASLEAMMIFLGSAKFRGEGDDWIRTGEVVAILQKIRNELVDGIDITQRL